MRTQGRECRRAQRTRRRNAAWIGLGNGGTHVPCVLWDISDTGARLAAPRSSVLPAAFSLLLTKDGRSQRLCRVVWRNDRQLGVRFVPGTVADLEQEEGALRRQAGLAPAPTQQAPVDAASLLLPGYGPRFLDKPERRGVPISLAAAGMLFALVAATVLFFFAGAQSALDTPWALAVCDAASNFCRHPEWTGIAGGLMAVVYLALRGMET